MEHLSPGEFDAAAIRAAETAKFNDLLRQRAGRLPVHVGPLERALNERARAVASGDTKRIENAEAALDALVEGARVRAASAQAPDFGGGASAPPEPSSPNAAFNAQLRREVAGREQTAHEAHMEAKYGVVPGEGPYE